MTWSNKHLRKSHPFEKHKTVQRFCSLCRGFAEVLQALRMAHWLENYIHFCRGFARFPRFARWVGVDLCFHVEKSLLAMRLQNQQIEQNEQNLSLGCRFSSTPKSGASERALEHGQEYGHAQEVRAHAGAAAQARPSKQTPRRRRGKRYLNLSGVNGLSWG